jgi:uncharacterized protein YjiS (DUF1127 family)
MRLAHIRLSYMSNSLWPEQLYIALHQHGATGIPETARRAGKRRNTPLIKTLTTKYTAWRRFRESVRELSRLSDRELNDLGIGRSDIVTVVRQSLQG